MSQELLKCVNVYHGMLCKQNGKMLSSQNISQDSMLCKNVDSLVAGVNI